MMPMTAQEISLSICGMTCASCTGKIQASLSRIDGVVSARVNYATERARVVYDPARTRAASLVAAVRGCGCDVLLKHVAVPLHAIGTVAVSRNAVVDARIDWRTRRVEIEWLEMADATPARSSMGTTLFLLTQLLHSQTKKT